MRGRLIDEPIRLSFGGHETFPFRLGWVRKGIAAATENGHAFALDDAVVRLGVGKNMVRSIRTWCLATQMLEEKPPAGTSRRRPLAPSPVAQIVMSEDGDPFLEDPGSLWLLHWLLVTNPDRLSLWRVAFMFGKENEFTKVDLIQLAMSVGERHGQVVESSPASRDADVFVRTYTLGRSGSAEEDFSCPLVALGLIASGGGDRFVFVVGPKRTLPAAVFGFAFAQYLHLLDGLECSLSDATYMPGSPGQAFRLDEDSIVELLRNLERDQPEQWLVNIDGPIRRVGLRRKVDPIDLLKRHYEEIAA